MYLLTKPGPLFQIKPTETGSIFLHTGENEEAFNRQLKLVSFFNEMRKFFPNYICEGMQGGSEKTYEFGDETTSSDIYWADMYGVPIAHEEDDLGYVYTRGYYARGIMDGEFANRYGDVHSNYIDGNFWGYGSMNCAANVSQTPWAGDYDSFSDFDPEGVGAPIELSDYKAMVYDGYGTGVPGLSSIGSDEWSRVQSYLLDNFEGKSFYDILLTGIQNSHIGTKLEARNIGLGVKNYNVIDGTKITHEGGFLYDGKEGTDGEGAYYLMLSMLEARRRIDYAYSYVLGSSYHIVDNDYMRDRINAVFNDADKLGGLEDSTLRPLYSYFGASHRLRSFLSMFAGGYNVNTTGDGSWKPAAEEDGLNHFADWDTGGFGGGNAFVFSGLDMAASQRFRHWIGNNVNDYIGTLSGDEKTRVQALLDEWTGKLESPFLSDEKDWNTAELPDSTSAGAYKSYLSWDRWTLELHPTTTGYNASNPPPGWNPLGGEGEDCHSNYAVFQIKDLTRQQMMGEQSVGSYADFTQANWVCNFVDRALRWKKGVEGQTTACMFINNTQRRSHQREIREYDQNKIAEANKKYNEAKLDQAQEKRIGELRRLRKPKNNKPANKAGGKAKAKHNANQQSQHQEQSNNTQAKPKAQQPVTMQKAMSSLYLQMFNKMRSNSKQKIKNANEANK